MAYKLKPLAAMIAIFGDLNNFDYAEEIYGTAVERGLMPAEVKENQLTRLSAHFATLPREVNKDTVLIDGALVAMQLMLVARAHGYDTNPIGGYEKIKSQKRLAWKKIVMFL